MNMSQNSIVAHLRDLIRRNGKLDAPAVDLLRPEIRTGDKFLLRDPFAGRAEDRVGDKAKRAIQKEAVGAIVVEWGYDVPAATLGAFMAFLDTFEEKLLPRLRRPGCPQ
jgi:hypothetical protein